MKKLVLEFFTYVGPKGRKKLVKKLVIDKNTPRAKIDRIQKAFWKGFIWKRNNEK